MSTIDISGQQPVLVADHGRSAADAYLGQLPERDLFLAVGDRDQDPAKCAQVAAEVTHVADIDRVAFAALDGGGHVFAADGALHHLLCLVNAQAVAGQLLPVPVDVEEISAAGTFGKDVAGPLDRLQERLRPGRRYPRW